MKRTLCLLAFTSSYWEQPGYIHLLVYNIYTQTSSWFDLHSTSLVHITSNIRLLNIYIFFLFGVETNGTNIRSSMYFSYSDICMESVFSVCLQCSSFARTIQTKLIFIYNILYRLDVNRGPGLCNKRCCDTEI